VRSRIRHTKRPGERGLHRVPLADLRNPVYDVAGYVSGDRIPRTWVRLHAIVRVTSAHGALPLAPMTLGAPSGIPIPNT
jgi:hypothetical protein